MSSRGVVRANLIPALLEASVRHGLRVLILVSLLGLGTLYPGVVSRAFNVLRDALKANETWVRTHTELRRSAGSESLFQQLVRLGLVEVVLRTGEIRIPNCNEVRTRLADPDAFASTAISASQRGEQTEALRRSCNSEFGRFVRRSIGAWNDGLTVLAVRDNALSDAPCIDPKGRQATRPKAYIPSDCHRTQWTTETQIDREWRAEGVRGLQPPSAAAFGFVAAKLLPGFGDWLRIASPPSTEPRRIAATFPPVRGRTRITIDLIGSTRAENVSVENGRLVKIDLLCDVRFGAANCSRDARERRAMAWRLEIERVPDAVLKVRIAAEPLAWRPAKMAELQSSFDDLRKSNPDLDLLLRGRSDDPAWPPDSGVETIHAENALALRCIDVEEIVPPCRLTFTVTPTLSERKRGNALILLGDKPLNEIVEGESRPTELAFETGLETLVGMGSFDYLALAPQLSRDLREGATRTVQLSLDPRLQAQTADVLKRAVGERSDRTFSGIHGTLPSAHDGNRRAGIVLIDLAREPGAIRAAAAWPAAPKGLNQWDLLALGSWQPTRNPFAPRLWAATDRFSTPGSTFKVVTSLALVQAAIDGDRTAQDIVKGLDLGGLQTVLSVDGRLSQYLPDGGSCGTVGKAIPNFRGAGTCASVGGCIGGNRLGLRRALQHSINTYFAASAVRLDRDIADQPNRAAGPAAPGQRPFYFLSAAERLFPAARFDLAAMPSARSIVGARSWATPFIIDSKEDPSCNRMQKLALNGIGQAAQASPVSMANALGTIALGNPIRPSLVAGGARRMDESVLRNWPGPAETNDYYKELLAGLTAVVRSGTAAGAFDDFPRILQRVAGKTGTAEPGGKSGTGENAKEPNTVWFVGWMADGPIGQQGSKPELAFACYVTHVGGTGGSVCAPMIARLLASIAARATAAENR